MQILDLKQAPGYLALLAQWHQDEWAYLNPGESLAQRLDCMQAYFSDTLIPSTFIAQSEAGLLGSAALIENDMDSRPELSPWLASVFVAPAYRNAGVGGALVRHVMQTAARSGIQTLYLFTPDRAAFYEKLGWQCLGEEVYRGHRVSLMQVELGG